MDQGVCACIGAEALDQLLPMHLYVQADGTIRHVGATLARLRPGQSLEGRAFFDLFEMRRPKGMTTVAELAAAEHRALNLHFREPPSTSFRGVIVPEAEGSGFVVNLSFGVALTDAIREYDLSSGDFAPTDLAVEMLYLIEAKEAIWQEWQRLNNRLQTAKTAAEEQAFTDTLTGLRNRRALDAVLGTLVGEGRPFGLVQLDLDFFKAVNDTLGHAAGDHVLKHAARAMVEATRQGDTLIRAGGDEFVLILPGLVDPRRLLDLSRRLIGRIEAPIPYGDQTCHISGSAGIAICAPGNPFSASALLAQADRALYASKSRGRGCATVYSEDLPDLAALKNVRTEARMA